ncbi:DUF2459 domain-containing protein [Tumidithrix elongata RA019]|uniref:DUF2459 domain-containing protein n=1 Tax=Tumidithrix elongata BACA0141 TaxID=2716417 RepID=A0AAW9QC27_9CYAN|nr:DUF2459 domain-containing protein [Tumidithrix elongata RA019]
MPDDLPNRLPSDRPDPNQPASNQPDPNRPIPRSRKQIILRGILFFLGLGLALAIAYFSHCPSPEIGLFPPPPQSRTHTIYLVKHDFHTGIAWSQTENIKEGKALMGAEKWKDSPYVEVGWGDRQFYYSNDTSILSMIRAMVIPSPSTLHVASFAEPPEVFFQFPVFQLELSEAGFEKLVAYIQRSFQTDAKGDRLPPISDRGQYGVSNFYESVPKYFFAFNCNTWAAAALHHAGLPICDRRTLLSEHLADRIKPYAFRIFAPPNSSQKK